MYKAYIAAEVIALYAAGWFLSEPVSGFFPHVGFIAKLGNTALALPILVIQRRKSPNSRNNWYSNSASAGQGWSSGSVQMPAASPSRW